MTSPYSGLPMAWLKGCQTEEEKIARAELVRNSVQFAALLLSIYRDRAEAIDRKGLREDDYADTGWVTLQAFRNGRLAELTELAELFKFLKGKHD